MKYSKIEIKAGRFFYIQFLYTLLHLYALPVGKQRILHTWPEGSLPYVVSVYGINSKSPGSDYKCIWLYTVIKLIFAVNGWFIHELSHIYIYIAGFSFLIVTMEFKRQSLTHWGSS